MSKPKRETGCIATKLWCPATEPFGTPKQAWQQVYDADAMDAFHRDEVVPVLRNLLKVAEDQHSRIGDIRKCDECHYAAEDADALLKGLADPEQQTDAAIGREADAIQAKYDAQLDQAYEDYYDNRDE